MFFSIIVPIYNVHEYLEECLLSILKQSFESYEVLMIDDGSTDGSAEICDSFALRDSRFKVIHQKNGGLVAARKAGALHAMGEYILNVDGDDYVRDGFLSDLNEKIVHNPADLYAFGYRTSLDSTPIINSWPIGFCSAERVLEVFKRYLYDSEKRGLNSGSLIFSAWSKAAKRDLYREAQLLVPDGITHGEDTLLTARLLSLANTMMVVDLSSYVYRIGNPKSMMNKFNQTDFRNLFCVKNELEKIDRNGVNFGDKTAVYCMTRVLDLAIRRAKHTSHYSDFKASLDVSQFDSLQDYAFRVRIPKASFRNALLLRALRKKWLFLFFVLARVR